MLLHYEIFTKNSEKSSFGDKYNNFSVNGHGKIIIFVTNRKNNITIILWKH